MKYAIVITLSVALLAGTAQADRYRSAESGKYVTPGYGTSHPSTTVKEGR